MIEGVQVGAVNSRWRPPVRQGLNATRVILPPISETPNTGAGGQYPIPATVAQYLRARFPDDTAGVARKIAQNDVYDGQGNPISEQTAYVAGEWIYLYRDPPTDEPVVPGLSEIEILYRDNHLLVIDKPHQVSVIPRGRWVTQTALVHLRRTLNLPQLSPLHRLDRPTAGVLVFSLNPEERGRYQTLFQTRKVKKEYLAVAGIPQDAGRFPRQVKSRIVKERGVAQAQVVPGEPNAITEIELLDTAKAVTLYRLKPLTGKTHQLRLHMNSLGLPILGDPFWPEMRPDLLADQTPELPLQLLAQRIEFTDPLTTQRRVFTSRRQLVAWPTPIEPE